MDRSFSEIYVRYEKAKREGRLISLENPATGKIRTRLLELLDQTEPRKAIEPLLRGFLNKKRDTRDIVEIVGDTQKEKFRPLTNFLNGGTKSPDSHGIRPLLDLLVGHDIKEDFAKQEEKESSQDSPVKEASVSGTSPDPNRDQRKQSPVFLLSVIGIVSVVAISSFFFSGKGSKEPCYYWMGNRVVETDCSSEVNGIKIEGIYIENINIETFRKVVPNNATDFFSEEGKPLLWYASYQGNTEFFNSSGYHPVSGKRLRPVPKEVVNTYLTESRDTKKDIPDEKENTVTLEEVSKTKTNLLERSIVIQLFDDTGSPEGDVSNHLKKVLSNSYKIVSTPVDFSSLDSKTIGTLMNGNVSGVQNSLEGKTQFLCTGKVSYTFEDSSVKESWRKCTMTVGFSITDIETGQVVDTYQKTLIGIGASDATAKTNTIQKLAL